MKTALYPQHVALGAKIVSFCGWEMPIQYRGILQEHLAVRNAIGLFDVSHMGRVLIEGVDAEKFLEYISTNRIAGKNDLSATYTVFCTENGGCVDDAIVYRQDSEHFFTIVNAGNREQDLKHLRKYAKQYQVKITERYQEDGILALQGPKAEPLLVQLFAEASELKSMHFIPIKYHGQTIILSRTGYTGSDGFEIYAPNESIVNLWETLLKEGQRFGIQPVGLGARDTLRLEMGYALYGHEISDTIAPTESVSAWTVKWSKGDFLGKKALEVLEKSPSKRMEAGLILLEKGIPREGCKVLKNGQPAGIITSGTYSPSLNQGIAIVLADTPLFPGDTVEVEIRTRLFPARIVKLPFYHQKEEMKHEHEIHRNT